MINEMRRDVVKDVVVGGVQILDDFRFQMDV
jgi:hypothetical protein